MRMSFKLSTLLLFLISTPVVAADSQFSFKGKLIHPDCISTLTDIGDQDVAKVDLGKCSSSLKGVTVRDDGYVYYEETQGNNFNPVFSMYKFIGKFDDLYVLDYANCGGGSGVYSGLLAVRLEKNELIKKYVVFGGDRANGGMADVKAEGGKVLIDVCATPAEVIRLSGFNMTFGDNYYQDLMDCAQCYCAWAVYEVNPSNGERKLVGVDLDHDIDGAEKIDADSDGRPFPYQKDFNFIYHKFIKSGKTKLDINGLRDFATQFRDRCLKDHLKIGIKN